MARVSMIFETPFTEICPRCVRYFCNCKLKPINSLRKNVWASDSNMEKMWNAQQGVCHLCGMGMRKESGDHPQAASKDHIHPKSLGGADGMENLMLAHKQCNSDRGNLSLEEWFTLHPLETKS